MDLVAVVAAGTSLLGAIVTVVLGSVFERRRQHAQRERARQDLADRYSQPLMAAASALASRLGNALDVNQVAEFSGGNAEQATRFGDYLYFETAYRLARYLCWVHIVSRELRVLDLGQRERNRQLVLRIADVQHAMNRRDPDGDLTFLLLGGEQWALGELMVEREGPDGEPRCMSYVTFRERMEEERFKRWFTPLLHDIETYASNPTCGAQRLRAVQAALYALVDLLDPEQIWVPFRNVEGAAG